MAPVLEEAGGAWEAVRRSCDREEAEERLTEPFRRAEVLAAHEDAMAMTVAADELGVLPTDVDYAREARRIFEHGEDYIHRVIADDVRRAFEDAPDAP